MRSIREFLSGRAVFLTGATGFLGKSLVEKILRNAPEVRRLYLLVRPGIRPNGTRLGPEERLRREIFETSIFSRLKQIHGERFEAFVDEKVVGIAGDVAADGLGLEQATRGLLEREVDTIIHSAASVVFDERIDHALELNTLGAERVMKLGRSLERPAAIGFVSTAYVSGERTGRILEEYLPEGSSPARLEGIGGAPGLDVAAEIAGIRELTAEVNDRARGPRLTAQFRDQAERMQREAEPDSPVERLLDEARERWVAAQLVTEGLQRARKLGWHDNYTYTKAMGEVLVAEARGELPLAVVRPSIIESSLAEPEPGWLNGLKVADPLIAAYAKGRLPDFPGRREVVLDLVPVDFVSNATVAALEHCERKGGVSIFHVATGHLNPVRIGEVFTNIQAYYLRNPMRDKKGAPIRAKDWKFPSPARFRAKYRYGVEWPLKAAAWVLNKTSWLGWSDRLRSRIRRTLEGVERLLYYTDLYSAYTNLDCIFDSSNTRSLWKGLSEEDRRKFNFDLTSIDWAVYLQDIHCTGLDRHVLRFGSAAAKKRRGAGEGDQALSADDLRTLPDLVQMSAERFGDKVALQTLRNGDWERVSYQDILEQAGLVGAVWRRAGLERGQRVVLMSENQPDWAIAYFAAQAVGATVVPLDTHTPPEEVEQILEFTEAKALLASEAVYPHLPKALRSSPLPIWNINDGGLPFAVNGGPRPEPPSPDEVRWEELSTDDVATIIFTSGPAVDPRGVMLTHRNFLSNLLALSEVLRSYETDRFVSVLPLHHALEFTGGLLMPLFSGALVTYSQTLKSKLLLELMEQTGATALLAVPRIFELLYDRLKRGMEGSGSEESCRELDSFASRMRLLVSGGAPLDHSISEAFASIGTPIHEGYGLTETAPIVTVNPLWGIRPRSVGKTLPGVELRLDPPGPDGDGEIVVRGPNLMKGYYKNPKATAHYLRDGWLYTGDLGRQDADGYLTITGRSKELIVTGAGKNVWPEEIELFYRDMEGVQDLAVFGLRPPGATRESVHAALYTTAAEDHVRKQMHNISRTRPTYQRIQRAHFYGQALPRSDDGGVDRKALRKAALEKLAAAKAAPRKAAAVASDAPWWERDAIALISRVAAKADNEPVVPRDTLAELLDSLQAVELLATLEGHFGLSLQDEELAALERVLDVLERIKLAVGDRVGGSGTLSPATDGDSGYWASMIASASEPGAEAISPLGASPAALPLQAAFQGAAALLLRGAWRLSVRGLDKLPQNTPFLVAANHSSHFDTASMLTALRRSTKRVHVLGARDYFFRSPASAWFFRNMLNVIPFDRDRNFVEGFRACRQVIRPDEPILIFPEGTRSVTGRLQSFKVGLGILALELGTPVVPARIRGSYEALPKGRSWPRLSRIEVAFGQPIAMTPYLERRDRTNTYEIYREVVNEVRQRIEQLIAEG